MSKGNGKLPPPPQIEPKYTKVIRIYGDLNRAKTADGIEVYRQKAIYFPSYSIHPIECCPYSVHFIFDDPLAHKPEGYGHWTPMCTCGGLAGIVGASVYTKLMSPTATGELLVCLTHMKTFEKLGHGVHADGVGE